uniref:F-box protein CPR30-like n=1 Tax=Nicotiana tabacum TaxID=4097 RepID=A0A1S4ACL3_TOBAC|nr:PREDICTED: F-box protein CPR30-like [Nicotiana tabacum]
MVDGIMKRFPEDVVIYILLRFRVKFLLRFKCISKTCYTLIKSSIFVNLHLSRTTNDKDEFILFKRSWKEETSLYKTIISFLSVRADDYLNPIIPDQDVPYMTATYSIEYDQLIGPCHGLIALMDDLNTLLFNPSTRKYMLLPPSPFNCPRNHYRTIRCVGFDFDSIANDYKVVKKF